MSSNRASTSSTQAASVEPLGALERQPARASSSREASKHRKCLSKESKVSASPSRSPSPSASASWWSSSVITSGSGKPSRPILSRNNSGEGPGLLDSVFFTNTSQGSAIDAQGERKAARARRGEIDVSASLYDKLGENLDKIIVESSDISGFFEKIGLASDAGQPSRARQVDAKVEGDQRHFGLPEFESTGYCLAPREETVWPDLNVPQNLGLQLATHRKTSIERFCVQQPKAELPSSVGKDQMLALARNLKKCDHANILRCHEVCEDDEYIYLLYDHFACVTLQSLLGDSAWTQEEVVNLVRECCAAVGYCAAMGLNHLSWTLSHILLPSSCLQNGPKFAKVFGFGLMGVVHNHVEEFSLFAPEAAEAYQRVGDGFVSRLEGTRDSCDLWSLGALIYTIISRRPPMMGQSQGAVRKKIIAREWSFNLAFDAVDPEAKQLVESLMHPKAKSRMKAEQAFFNPWIRRRWKPFPHASETFLTLEKFCASSLPKRLFGRFLVQFLDASHMTRIAEAFYSLDSQGYGTVDARDLRITCKMAQRHINSVQTIMSWMCREGSQTISLAKFAECMAEEVIDGKALRHSFESLDDDGSGCISAAELYDELKPFCSELKMSDIVAHIESSEVANSDGEAETASDHKLNYDEYMQLFPGRLRHVQALADRTASTRTSAKDLHQQFESVKAKVQTWMKVLEMESTTMTKLQSSLDSDAVPVVKDLKKRLDKVAKLLALPPGPADLEKQMAVYQAEHKKGGKKKGAQKHVAATVYGFDSFMQDHAIHSYWPSLIDGERNMLKHSVHGDSVAGTCVVDTYKAADSVNFVLKKIEEVLEWTRYQLEEYESIVDVLDSTEDSMHSMVYSNRGLQKHDGNHVEEEAQSKADESAVDIGAHSNWLSDRLSNLVVGRCTSRAGG